MTNAGEAGVDSLGLLAACRAADHARADPLEAELLLDAKRGGVVEEDARTDYVEAELVEQEGKKSEPGFGGIAFAPGRFRQPVAEFTFAVDAGQPQPADHAAIV